MCLRTGRVHDQLMRANVDRCCCSEDGGQSRAYAGGGPRACPSSTDMGAGVLGGLQGELRHMANMSAMRRTAIVAGSFYLATEVKRQNHSIALGTITAVRSPGVEGHSPLPLA